MPEPIYYKTALGQQEIRTRAHKLDPKQRTLLLLINGERGRAELLAQLDAMGVGPDAFTALQEAGLIAAIAAAADDVMPSVTPSAPPEPQQIPSPAMPDMAPLSSHSGTSAGSYQQVYQFYTEAIGQHLGLRGYLLQMKVEKASTLPELLALRAGMHAALVKAKGEPTAHAIIAQLDRLVDGGQAGTARA